MTTRRLGTTVLFILAFVPALLLGRLTTVPDTQLALVAPATGIVALWFATIGWSRVVVVDLVALFVLAGLLNHLTGASVALAAGLGLAAVVQVGVFGLALQRWAPHLWGRTDDQRPRLRELTDLGHVLAATLASTVVSAVIGPASVFLLTGDGASVFAQWVVRQTVGVVAVFPLGLLLLNRLQLQWRGPARSPATGVTPTHAHRVATKLELALLVVVSATACWLIFVVNRDLPLVFVLIGASVWVGVRFSPLVAGAHSLLLGIAVVVVTLDGHGPLAQISDPGHRALVVQAFVLLTVVVATALAIGREESARLTGRLAQAESRATGQAHLLTTILNSLADGVTVVGEGGRVVMRNPAGSRLIGGDLAAASVIRPELYGLFHLDGRAVAPAELPYARALAGEEITGLELFMRTPGMPEGRLLEVSASPLPQAGDPLAVMVFHDVTADRRERDELASFAGVVAHDLLNPLTTVEGWSEALLEEIREPAGGDPALEEQHLARIQRAARRMRDLINDLLAYTTARDLKINPVRVDLASMVRDIVRSRTESAEDEWAQPVITVGELPDVSAEPVLLRQVIDNIIGNSVKYVAPGVVPVIEIRARAVDELVEIEISDNGIGIPQGHHASVFDTFHRANTDGYRGTGLGLSIVKRVVERHGGTITATDNPRHAGTTMQFTFPAP